MSVADSRISPLKGVVAVEAMRPGVIAVPAGARLRDVASVMAVRGIHAILVKPEGEDRAAPHAVVSDLEVVRAALAGDPAELRMSDLRAESLPTVDGEAPLEDVAAVMVQRRAAHVLVGDASGPPAACCRRSTSLRSSAGTIRASRARSARPPRAPHSASGGSTGCPWAPPCSPARRRRTLGVRLARVPGGVLAAWHGQRSSTVLTSLRPAGDGAP